MRNGNSGGNNGFHGGGPLQSTKPYIPGIGNLGDYRDNRPVPPIAEYIAYEETLDSRARKHFNAYRHRRVTILVRNGETFNEACRLAGFRSVGAVREVRAKMPEHLR